MLAKPTMQMVGIIPNLSPPTSGTINAIAGKVDMLISDCIERVVQQLKITPDCHYR